MCPDTVRRAVEHPQASISARAGINDRAIRGLLCPDVICGIMGPATSHLLWASSVGRSLQPKGEGLHVHIDAALSSLKDIARIHFLGAQRPQASSNQRKRLQTPGLNKHPKEAHQEKASTHTHASTDLYQTRHASCISTVYPLCEGSFSSLDDSLVFCLDCHQKRGQREGLLPRRISWQATVVGPRCPKAARRPRASLSSLAVAADPEERGGRVCHLTVPFVPVTLLILLAGRSEGPSDRYEPHHGRPPRRREQVHL
jgi:hypothetical protein